MPKYLKPKINLKLPRDPKYRTWSRQSIQNYTNSKKFREKYITYVDDYKVSKDTLAIFNFKKKPLLDKYLSCVLDLELGVLLCKRPPSALLYQVAAHSVFPSYMIQKNLRDTLHIKQYYILMLGYNALFSSHGFFTRNCDWVSLQFIASSHQVNFYMVKKKEYADLIFTSLAINGISYQIEFTNCNANLKKHLAKALALYDITQEELKKAEFQHTYLWYAKQSLLKQDGEHSVINCPHLSIPDLTHTSIKNFTKSATRIYAEHTQTPRVFHTDFNNSIYKNLTKTYF